MPTDFTQYQQPGVYVESISDGVVTTAGVPEATVTLVGPSQGYQSVTQSISILDSNINLSKQGVLGNADPSPNLVVHKSDGTVLVSGTDYDVTFGSTSADYTQIKRHAGATSIASGDTVYVTYSYAGPEYYLPKAFEEFSTVEAVYGPCYVSATPDAGDTQVHSPLSLAARKAFENGAPRVICVATEAPGSGGNTYRARFSQAYDKIANSYDHTLVVAVLADIAGDGAAYTSGIQGYINDLKTHCVNQSDDGYRRIGLVGLDSDYDDTTTTFDEIAAATAGGRMLLAYPHVLEDYNNNLLVTTEVGGCYLAAAYAGRLARTPVNRGLTHQQIFGFTGIPTRVRSTQTRSAMNTLSAAGVAVSEVDRRKRLVVRHGTSTDPSTLLSTEISLTRAGDTLYQLVRDGLGDADLIGDAIDEDMTMRVKGIVTGILETAKADKVIRDYPFVQVRQQSLPEGNPTVIEIQFAWQPFLPLNYITVTFALDLTTGQVTTDEALAA